MPSVSGCQVDELLKSDKAVQQTGPYGNGGRVAGSSRTSCRDVPAEAKSCVCGRAERNGPVDLPAWLGPARMRSWGE